LTSLNLTQKVSDAVQSSLLSALPDIVIATPGRASLTINNGSFNVSQLGYLVIDEADLVLSYGYKDDLENVSKAIPKGVQSFLMSATLTQEVELLKDTFCRKPVILKLEEGVEGVDLLDQYVVR
jgi:ATP-dependent RNA helicase DDX56/DBP9